MDIELFANEVIVRIKAFPPKTLFSQDEVGPKSMWDEYKENYQYEEYEFFDYELFQDTIKGMIEDEMTELSGEDIYKLYYSFNDVNHLTDIGEMCQEIERAIFDCIHDKALSEEIEYQSPLYNYVEYWEDEYSEDGLIVVAEVIKKVSPDEFLLQTYSKETPIEGEPEYLSLTRLEQDCGLVGITRKEFEEIIKTMFAEPVVVISENITEPSEGITAKDQDDKELKAKNMNTTSRALISVSEDGRVSVARFNPHFSAVRIDGVWSWGTFSPDDFKDNFRLILEDNEPALFHKLLNEASKALADIPKPKSIPVR